MIPAMRDDEHHYFLTADGWKDGGFLCEGKGEPPSKPEGCFAHYVHYSPNKMYSTAYGRLLWRTDDKAKLDDLLKVYGRDPYLAAQKLR